MDGERGGETPFPRLSVKLWKHSLGRNAFRKRKRRTERKEPVRSTGSRREVGREEKRERSQSKRKAHSSQRERSSGGVGYSKGQDREERCVEA